jgi:hypothetical protein
MSAPVRMSAPVQTVSTPLDAEAQRAEAFGRGFVLLMARLSREHESQAAGATTRDELEQLRSSVTAAFVAELEELVRRYAVPEVVAVYVRHVVRQGFEADFDPLDPVRADPGH